MPPILLCSSRPHRNGPRCVKDPWVALFSSTGSTAWAAGSANSSPGASAGPFSMRGNNAVVARKTPTSISSWPSVLFGAVGYGGAALHVDAAAHRASRRVDEARRSAPAESA